MILSRDRPAGRRVGPVYRYARLVGQNSREADITLADQKPTSAGKQALKATD